MFTEDGEVLRYFGDSGLGLPSGIAIDGNDRVFVTEYTNNRVSLFTSEGKFLDSFGSQAGKFNDPRGVTVDRNGIIYVCDTENDRLQYCHLP